MYVRYIKRFADILGALVLLLFLFWLILLIVLLYLISQSFPVFFKQRRIGKNDRPFTLFKFRTLKSSGLSLTERRFPLGSLLRRLSLDELPQLLNVLRGEMSLIGPRPLPIEYLTRFSTDQRKRHRVRPGITGWAQVNGRNEIPWDQKFSFDLYYVENVSLFLDAKIIVRTISLLLSFRRDSSLSEKEFQGNA